jgi:hypothetical protein
VKLGRRPLQSEDIPQCVQTVANHPVVRHRYGQDIELLSEAWLRVLSYEAKVAISIFDEENPCGPFLYFGITVFLRDDFVSEMKKAPLCWVGSTLARRIVRGESPVLSDLELREANSHGGLNLVCWGGLVRPGYETNQELHRYMMRVFIEEHQGFLFKEIFSEQLESRDRLSFTLKTGGRLWDPVAGSFNSSSDSALEQDLNEIVNKPHLVGTTRELEQERQGNWSGSWVGALFDYHPPIIGFSRREQDLLRSALAGTTDEDLAGILGTSLPAVKKMWVSIYRRVGDRLRRLISDPIQLDTPANSRGRERRRSLLAYLRDHPEELRPISRKILSQTQRMPIVTSLPGRPR